MDEEPSSSPRNLRAAAALSIIGGEVPIGKHFERTITSGSSMASTPETEGTIECPRCTLLNPLGTRNCDACELLLPKVKLPAASMKVNDYDHNRRKQLARQNKDEDAPAKIEKPMKVKTDDDKQVKAIPQYLPSKMDLRLNSEIKRMYSLEGEKMLILKKNFTRWANSFLAKHNIAVTDIFAELCPGDKLIHILKDFSDDPDKVQRGAFYTAAITHAQDVLKFIQTKIRVECIPAEDIVKGEGGAILGVVWTIIKAFLIHEISVDVDEDDKFRGKVFGMKALLLWCQRSTSAYPNVNIKDFTKSWRDGLAFNALIHAHYPTYIEFDKLDPNQHVENLNNAFEVSERRLGIPSLLDAEDIDIDDPDEQSILMYVSTFYQHRQKELLSLTSEDKN